MQNTGRFLIFLGTIFIFIGVLFLIFPKLSIYKFPGDIFIKRDNFIFYFPVFTSIILSILLTILLNLFLRR
uniref:DUF2905 domain-containing protein n=1 Tax=candidate division WOR-3 bacterium TaxID=2052148 RepID=A0A7C4XJK6_UNCW3